MYRQTRGPRNILGSVGRLSSFCQEMLSQLPRADQRRWGEIYVAGLINVPGRKSVRRIADYIVNSRADQGIQQFVNQSPWTSGPVRQGLANYLSSLFRPEAWVVDEVVLPKNGSSSVGVARQYAPSAGRVLNCQIGLGVFFAGAGIAPVNWRLLLPPEWDTDATRRARAHVPPSARHKSRWEHIIDAVDEMRNAWELDPAPIVVDAQHDTKVEPLLQALEQRGLAYVVRVASGTQMVDGQAAATTIGEFVQQLSRTGPGNISLTWQDGEGPATTSRFLLQPLPMQTSTRTWWRTHSRTPLAPRRLLIEWPSGRQRPSGIWLTNLSSARPPQLIGLARAHRRTSAEMGRLCEDYGLAHFEGRSFRGWHHHATLVSLAHCYTLTQDLQDLSSRLSLRTTPA
jgi:SRSO17 transposase